MSGNFGEFLESLDPDPANRGRQFEHFVKWFLKADPEWSTQVDQVWLWNEWPERWGPDCGIDLIFRHRNGETWAVQAKCYAATHDITKHDVDKFLSESNRPQIHGRLLMATTDGIGANARQVCEAQEKPVVRYLRGEFDKAEVDYPSRFADLSSGGRRPPPSPRPHQVEAIDAVVVGFQDAARGQLIMACGTGKTYVTLWVRERLQAGCTLVLVPSLGLLSQILREWTFAAQAPFDVLCVCSDASVGARGADEAINSIAELAFPVTSDVQMVRRFLSGAVPRVVFSTYQSSPVIAEAQIDPAVPAFDLAVADEAHRCAGKAGNDFSAILAPERIRCRRRLFATATPRTYSSTLHKRAEERGVEIVGMDNVEQFGTVLHALPFGKAIERKLLTDYRVVIIGVDDPMIAQWITRRELVSTGTGVETDSESLAAQIGLLKAIQDYDLKRIISFHSRVSRAREFAAELPRVMSWCDEEHRPSGSLRADHVSGDMPTSQRRIKLDQLRHIADGERAVLSNARCLSEGVDVPALDGVAFIDPRSSQVDIIQAVGRAIRLSADKRAGTIVLPVFIHAGEDAAGVIDASNFKPVWEVLNALKAHDDVLACRLDEIRTEQGRRSTSEVGAESLAGIKFDLPATVDANFPGALRTYLVDQVTASWNHWFGLLEAFIEREGHARVPPKYKTPDGYRLGQWVHAQRVTKEDMTPERRARLEALPSWSWNLHADKWEEGYCYLKEFADREGHAKVSPKYTTPDGYRLGQWVNTQRMMKVSLALERKARLEALSSWSWNLRADKWEEGYCYLKEFADREGHARVPPEFRTPDGYRLGQWVNTQRMTRESMMPERMAQLEALPDWSWPTSQVVRWEEGYQHLKEFADREGHSRMPTTYKSPDGYALGAWVVQQRQTKDNMSPERKARLDAVPGWSWGLWLDAYCLLMEYAKREGHSKVPKSYKTLDGCALGLWVAQQRRARETMPSDRQAQLEALPDWSWGTQSEQWEDGYAHLKEFAVREGHLNMPLNYTTVEGYPLAAWASIQKRAKSRTAVDRRLKLEALPGWIWVSDPWEEGFGYLSEFVNQMGHAKVQVACITKEGYKLGAWVTAQRQARVTMRPDRKERLDALPQWSWSPSSDAWEEAFVYLKEFGESYGHTRIPCRYKTADGFALGRWVRTQRKAVNLSLEQRNRLEALPKWNSILRDKSETGLKTWVADHIVKIADRTSVITLSGLRRAARRQIDGMANQHVDALLSDAMDALEKSGWVSLTERNNKTYKWSINKGSINKAKVKDRMSAS